MEVGSLKQCHHGKSKVAFSSCRCPGTSPAGVKSGPAELMQLGSGYGSVVQGGRYGAAQYDTRRHSETLLAARSRKSIFQIGFADARRPHKYLVAQVITLFALETGVLAPE